MRNKPIIICIDDELTVLDSLKIELKRVFGNSCIIETAEGGQDALDLFQELIEDNNEIAVVISDYIMPDIKGDEVLKEIHRVSPKTINIMLTGQASLEGVTYAINYAQLYRYVAKPWETEDLKLTITEALKSYLKDKKLEEQNNKLKLLNQELESINHDLEKIVAERTVELEKANQELHRLATLDALTQLPNRRRFDQYLTLEWQRLLRDQQPLSLIMCDVDYFKRYNDYYGHQSGDACLQQVAKVLTLSVNRITDLVARYGGEEFALILPNTDSNGAITVANNLKALVEQLKLPHAKSEIKDYLTLSLGISTMIPNHDLSPMILIKTADQALYQAKQQGRDRFVVFAE